MTEPRRNKYFLEKRRSPQETRLYVLQRDGSKKKTDSKIEYWQAVYRYGTEEWQLIKPNSLYLYTSVEKAVETLQGDRLRKVRDVLSHQAQIGVAKCTGYTAKRKVVGSVHVIYPKTKTEG